MHFCVSTHLLPFGHTHSPRDGGHFPLKFNIHFKPLGQVSKTSSVLLLSMIWRSLESTRSLNLWVWWIPVGAFLRISFRSFLRSKNCFRDCFRCVLSLTWGNRAGRIWLSYQMMAIDIIRLELSWIRRKRSLTSTCTRSYVETTHREGKTVRITVWKAIKLLKLLFVCLMDWFS